MSLKSYFCHLKLQHVSTQARKVHWHVNTQLYIYIYIKKKYLNCVFLSCCIRVQSLAKWLSLQWLCFLPIMLQDSLIINISGRNSAISQIFFMEIVIKRRQHQGLLLLIGCDQLCLFSNPVAGLFNDQYLWKQSSGILVFRTELVIKGGQHLALSFLVVQASCASHSIILQDSLIISVSGRNRLISQSFAWG